MKFRAQLSTGTFVYCQGTLAVKVTPPLTTNPAGRYAGADPFARTQTVAPAAGETWGAATLQIRYSVKNTTRTSPTPRLRKPLIYVEGYDVENDYDIMDLIKNSSDGQGEWIELFTNTGYDFMGDLDDQAEYDLVFVNYDTKRSFTDNTVMLQRVIEWVNTDKALSALPQPNVVIGTSAGGVLSRYTLARMTKQLGSTSTGTRLLITHDSPHQGANVPLAFQHFLFDLGECSVLGQKIKDNKKDLKDFYELNTKPATAELLKARVVEADAPVVFNTFLVGDNSPYQTMMRFSASDPQPAYRFIATAQGSQCGVPVMPADNLVLASQNGPFSRNFFTGLGLITLSTKYTLQTTLKALPGGGSTQIEYFNFSRRIALFGVGIGNKVLRERNRYNPSGFASWDAAPGSTQSIKSRTNGALTGGLTLQSPWYAAGVIVALAGLNMNISNDLFSFVPTVSALDAPLGTPLNQPYIQPITGNGATRTEKYIAQESFTSGGATYFNQDHTAFTARNAKWIYQEMETTSGGQAAVCESTCNTYAIEERGNVCGGTKKYGINLPVSLGVTWSVSPSGIVALQTDANVVSLYFLQPGNVTLTASFTNGCGVPQTLNLPLNITDQRSFTNDYVSVNDANTWCPGDIKSFSVAGIYPQFTSYQWTVTPGLVIVSPPPYGPSVQVRYNGSSTAPETIEAIVFSPCYQPVSASYFFQNFGDHVEGTITWPGTRGEPLQPDNNVPENNATVSITVAGAAAGVQYDLVDGLPEVWGVFASRPNAMFVYNRAGGSFKFEASFANNSPCGPIAPLPFTINLTNARQDYTKVFRVYPNPLGITTPIATVDIDPAATASPLIQDCINNRGRLRVEMLDFNGNPTGIVINAAPGASQVFVNMSSQPQGQTYLFVIRVLDCPSGIYQEVHQVIY
ncbi:MAG: hypothetical protein JWP69_118 [Flaviaesturariibacter sp.]|nr:hypothetical protein [Flaviaesturariibacter sp.]